MFYLSKILTNILLPPGLFLLTGAAAFILLLTKQKKTGLLLMGMTGLFLYLFSIRPVSESLIASLEEPYFTPRVTAGSDPGIIVVLGGGTVCRYDRQGREQVVLSPQAQVRLIEGVSLMHRTGFPLVFSGGNVLKGDNWPGEVRGAENLMTALGVESDRYQLEGQSRNTWENGLFVREKYHPRLVYLVTSAYHMGRAEAVFTRLGMEVVPVPVDFRAEHISLRFLDFLPGAEHLRISSMALHERLGMLYYTIRYY